jgi:hypothetical protein
VSRTKSVKCVSAKKYATFINVDGLNIVIFPKNGGCWGSKVGSMFLPGVYKTEDRAKLAAFDFMIFARRPVNECQ